MIPFPLEKLSIRGTPLALFLNGRSEKKAGQEKATAVHSSPPTSPAGEGPEVEDSRSLQSESPTAGLNDRWMVSGVCIFLAVIIWVVFGQTLGHEFVNYDDNLYVYENAVVQKSLTWEGFRWALTYGQIGHWHPLTWLSHMLDCQFYGLSPGGHHLTNILLHTATAILLFLVLRRMTGFLWRSAFVAAVFAIHPLRAESVAWIAERKDVLSAFFFMLTLGAYVRYVQKRSRVESRESRGQAVPALDPRPPGAAKRSEDGSTLDYCLVLLFFALGLLSKNMLVTLPFVLLLLDYWPLNRLSSFSPRVLLRRVAEKIPLFMLTVGSCVATVLVPEKLIAGQLPFGLRMENAVVSYVTYLWQMIHPAGLACLYPNPANYLPLWQVAGALGLLLAISGAVWTFRQTHPCLVVGWLWYLGMMIPVIGIVQISGYAHADRYTYLPQIGLYLLLTWTAADLCAGWRHRRVVLGGGSTVILMALVFCARAQTSYWRNSESLWTHALTCTSDNFIGHNNLGSALLKIGSVDEAIAQYQKALQIKPDFAEAHNNLGNALLKMGNVDEAIAQYQKALQIKPDSAEAHNNLGTALIHKGSVDEAIVHYQKALQIKSDSAAVRNNLDKALLQKRKVDEAITHYQKALQIKPDSPDVLNNLAWLLATCPDAHIRDGVQAVKYAERACELTHYGVTLLVGTLAAAYAEAGRFGDAIAAAQKACALATAAGEQDLLEKNQKLLALYRAYQPYHEAANKFVRVAP
jgi:tetratricopeptide (TPR) repeat protein